MPCFQPLQTTLIEKTLGLVSRFGIVGPFLEIGCGDGSLTAALSKRGMKGVALDASNLAVEATKDRLKTNKIDKNVRVLKSDILSFQPPEEFQLIVIYDVLEHIEEDVLVIDKIRKMLKPGGYLFLSVPVKMNEWRWDDDGYGHVRRYEQADLDFLIDSSRFGFKKLIQWDFTFPVIWMMRRIYAKILSPAAKTENKTLQQKNEESAFDSAAGNGWLMAALVRLPIWSLLFKFQDLFKNYNFGCNTIIVSKLTELNETINYDNAVQQNRGIHT